MAQESPGSIAIMVSIILGISIVGSSYLLSTSLDRTAAQLELAISSLQTIEPGAAAAKPRADRPDPGKVYEVTVGQSPFKGPANAKVTIVEFSDFQCPFCGRVNPTLNKIRASYPEDVRVAFKHFPLPFHNQAPGAHAAAEAAHLQGEFWEMHDKIFANPKDLNPATFERYAGEIGLDVEQFKKDVISKRVQDRISGDKLLAAKLQVSGTPGFFVNGRFLSGNQPFDSFKRLIDAELDES